MKEFEKEKNILKGIEKAESVEKRSVNKICDWADDQERAILRSDKQMSERKKQLDIIVPTRVCPSCKNKIFHDSYWVVVDNLAWCRSCFHSNHKVVDGEVRGSIITKVIFRVEYDGWKIKTLRHKMGVGAYAFSLKCGWTKGYQEQIECNTQKSLSLETINKIIQVFEDIGVKIVDSI